MPGDGMEAPLEAGKAQLMPKLLSDGNVDQVEDDERMTAQCACGCCLRQSSYELGRGMIANIHYISE